MKKSAIFLIILFFTADAGAAHDLKSFKLFQANNFFNQKQYETAIKMYKEILLTSKNENERVSCQKGIAESYDRLGNFEEAVKEYETLIKNYPKIPEINIIRERLAELYQINNNPEKQLEVMREMTEREPLNPNYIFLLGRFYEKNNFHARAQELYEKKFDLLPFNTDLQERLFHVYEKRNILEQKINNLEDELNQNPSKNHVRRLLVNFHLWQKKYLKAVSVWEKNPNKDFSYFEILGNLYFESDRKNEAISIWKNIFFQNPNELTLQITVSIFNKKGLINESLNCLLEARKIFHNPFIYHREIFEIYLLQMQNERAFEELLSLLNYSSEQLPLVISELHDITKNLKNPQFMVEKTQAEISKKPESGELYKLLGEIYLETNQPDLSIPCLEKAGELEKNREITLVQLGEKLINKKFYNEAITTFNKIKDFSTFGPLANYQIALSFYNLKNYDSSLNILNEMINESVPAPYILQSYALKGEIFFETHNLLQAKETLGFFKNLPEQNEIIKRALFRLAEAEFFLGNFNEAEKQFKYIAGNPSVNSFLPASYFYLAETYFLEDEFEKAKESFEDFARKFPSEPETNKSLLRIFLLNKNRGNEAELRILTKAIREKNSYKLPDAENGINDFIGKNPGSPVLLYFLMELGEIYSLEKKWKEALDVYEKIKKMDLYFYKQKAVEQLALIYEKNFKDTSKAKDEYIKLLTDFPENPVIELIRKKIEELKP
ncbi:MAG: tetratricopeptide repeat protein [bacterium]